MREFPIGPGKYFQKIKGDVSVLPAEDQEKIKEGRISFGEPPEKEKTFESWLKSGEGEAVLDRRHKKAVFSINGALADFCIKHDIKISPPPITYYISEKQWPKVVDFYGEDVIGPKGGGVADTDNRILINVREMRPDNSRYNNHRLVNFVDNNSHENLHQLAYRSIKVIKTAEEKGEICFDRWGVTLHNSRGCGKYFIDFDEGIIAYFSNKLTNKTIKEHKDLLYEEFDEESGAAKKYDYAMRDPLANIVECLIKRLAESRGGGSQALEEVEKIFIGAEFRGDLVSLNEEISKLYGRGGLWVLAHLWDGKEDNNRELVLKFIKAKTRETQEHYAFRVLAAEKGEFERYKRLMAKNGSDAR
jgi:hypothetical protein